MKSLIVGGQEDALWPHLRRVLVLATEVDIAVSFIKVSGVKLIFDDLKTALLSNRKVRLRILTSDYLNVTDPEALKELHLLVELGADVRVFQTAKQSFHLKSYLFVRRENEVVLSADAFVGSSNISRMALLDGLEWNFHIDYPNDQDRLARARIKEVREAFVSLFNHSQTIALTDDWLEQYQLRCDQQRLTLPGNSVDAEVMVLSEAETLPVISPHPHQQDALVALNLTRHRQYKKGLVVLATGLGKTFLAAFDAQQLSANRVLFVAHREEILLQAQRSFLAVLPKKRTGLYSGQSKDRDSDLLFASIQTIGRDDHLKLFAPDHFDYIVIDEFHHTAAGQYQALLNYFRPKFLLGLTATPERSDRLDILRYCDHNLVFRFDLFDGIRAQKLCPFHYYGILDTEVDYDHIPWRNGKFDPAKLTNKLATLGRAQHVLKEWRERGKTKTLAFCVSKKHADFMADFFVKQGVAAASVHTDSSLSRGEALEQLASGQLSVLFSVDLFNEGVDVPSIDTVMMLRPTESSVLFLQQLGRGLRRSDGKPYLTVLDFVGNHHSFVNRPGLIFEFAKQPSRTDLVKAMRDPQAFLPDGCFVNYDLEFIEFVATKESSVLVEGYWKLKERYKRRPTLSEFASGGFSINTLRRQYGGWWGFLDSLGELSNEELAVLEPAAQWLLDVQDDHVSEPFPMIELQSLIQQGIGESGIPWRTSAAITQAWFVGSPEWQLTLEDTRARDLTGPQWSTEWHRLALSPLLQTNKTGSALLGEDDGTVFLSLDVSDINLPQLREMAQELIHWRLTVFRQALLPTTAKPVVETAAQMLYFPHIQMACGHFRNGHAGDEQYVMAPDFLKGSQLERLFIARAKGNSMNGGKSPILDGDYLLFEYITPDTAGKISDQVVAIERQDTSGDDQYLLRRVIKQADGGYTLRANNPDYADMTATDEMVTFARLKSKVDPLSLFVGHAFMREDIPALFGVEYQAGSWASGYVPITGTPNRVLLVTINSNRGGQDTYANYFVDQKVFHWQSQNSTTPESKRGQEITRHRALGLNMYLFVRENRLQNGKAAPFVYYGEVEYVSHSGSQPIDVNWRLLNSRYQSS